jgi:anaerobic carbon-monoxide dehydrogenase iron sulfur subunit
MKAVFLNPEKCIGCRQCSFACAVEHSVGHDELRAWLEDPPPRARVHVDPGPTAGTSYPSRCRHCDPAPCVQVCPTSALTRDTAVDLVLLDPVACIDCAMCAMVCPFDALTFHTELVGEQERTVAIKCDGCVDRVRRGEVPACVEVCKAGALVYGELNELVAEGRLRTSGAVLASVSAAEAAEDLVTAGPVRSWRAWGEQAADVQRTATSDEGGRR